MANLEQSKSSIPNTSVKLTFSLTVTFDVTKMKTKIKNLEPSSHIIAVFDKNANFCQKIADISK